MKLLFTSDLHGREDLYRQLVAAVREERPDVVLLGGDLCGDCLRHDPLSEQVRFVHTIFAEAIAQLRQDQPRLPIGLTMGNHDLSCAALAMSALGGASRVQVLEPSEVWRASSLAVTGYPCCPPSGWWTWDYERLDRPGDPLPANSGAVWDEDAAALVDRSPEKHFTRMPTMQEELSRAACPRQQWVFVAHAPPYDSGLDCVLGGDAVGSRAVREFITRAQPTISLHGHFHDSPDVSGRVCCRIGRTLAINVGQDDDRLIYACLDVEAPGETLVVRRGTAS